MVPTLTGPFRNGQAIFPCTHKLGERTGQLGRDNSSRVRIHEKNSGDAVSRLGTIIQSIFCAQSGASIHLTVWKWSGESRYPVAFPPVLENFRHAFSLGPTDRPWVSEDSVNGDYPCQFFFEFLLIFPGILFFIYY